MNVYMSNEERRNTLQKMEIIIKDIKLVYDELSIKTNYEHDFSKNTFINIQGIEDVSNRIYVKEKLKTISKNIEKMINEIGDRK